MPSTTTTPGSPCMSIVTGTLNIVRRDRKSTICSNGSNGMADNDIRKLPSMGCSTRSATQRLSEVCTEKRHLSEGISGLKNHGLLVEPHFNPTRSFARGDVDSASASIGLRLHVRAFYTASTTFLLSFEVRPRTRCARACGRSGHEDYPSSLKPGDVASMTAAGIRIYSARRRYRTTRDRRPLEVV